MVKKLPKHRNSTDGHRRIVAPAEHSERRQKKFEAAQHTANQRYAKAFKEKLLSNRRIWGRYS